MPMLNRTIMIKITTINIIPHCFFLIFFWYTMAMCSSTFFLHIICR